MVMDTEYVSSSHTAFVGSKPIAVTSMTPIFSDEEEKRKIKQKIERELYDIFSKYVQE